MEGIHNFAIRRIKEEIPREILNEVFFKPNAFAMQFQQNINLDSAIAQAILEGSVFLDLQLLDGRETTIDLEGLAFNMSDNGTAVINVPYERTGGRDILECYHVEFSTTTNKPFLPTLDANPSDMKLDAIVSAVNPIPLTSTSYCTVIAPNTILVELDDLVTTFLAASVNLAVDKSLSHIPPKAFELFGELCVENCKRYLYTYYRIKLGQGKIERGMDLGVWAEEIAEYADAGKNYRDLLKRWRKVAFRADNNKMSKYLKLITPSIM